MTGAKQITKIVIEKMLINGIKDKNPNAPPAIAAKIAICFNNNSLIIIFSFIL